MLQESKFTIECDEQAYKNDKGCKVCERSFGMFRSSKKHQCKFCNRGVCSKCSGHKEYQEILGKKARICDICYDDGIARRIKQVFEVDLKREQSDIHTYEQVLESERQIKIVEELRNRELREEIESLNTLLSEEEQKYAIEKDKISSENEKIYNELMNITSKIDEVNSKIIRKKRKCERISKDIEHTKKITENDRNKLESLKSSIENQKSEADKIRNTLCGGESSKEEFLNKKIKSAVKDIENCKKKITQLRTKLKSLGEEKDARESELALLSRRESEASVVEQDYQKQLKELLRTINVQKDEISILEATDDPETLEEEEVSLTDKRCKCTLF